MMAVGYWQVLILAMAIMAFGIGVFYLTLSGIFPTLSPSAWLGRRVGGCWGASWRGCCSGVVTCTERELWLCWFL